MVNEKKFVKGRFEWQEGYGAFSYSKLQAAKIIDYVQNQEAHHGKLPFLEEYKLLLKEFDVRYNEQYLFKEAE